MIRFVRSVSTVLSVAALLAAGWGGDAVVSADDESAATAHGHEHADEAEAGHGHADEAAADGEHHADDGHGSIDYNKPPLDIDPRLLVWSLIVFLAYIWAAKRFAWLPLIKGLDARESRVNRALADAEAARMEAEKLLTDHQKHLDKVTEEVQGIIAQARTDAEQEKARIIAEAEQEALSLRDGAIADIHAAREQALAGLDERIDSQVETATRHVLG